MSETQSTPKVVALKPAVNDECVGLCRELLARAEAGDMTEIAFVWRHRNTDMVSGFTKSENTFERIGHLTRLQHRILLRLEET